jgi:hypothetical protein
VLSAQSATYFMEYSQFNTEVWAENLQAQTCQWTPVIDFRLQRGTFSRHLC